MGLFGLFAGPLGLVMHWIYKLIPNYFLALLVFTVLVRLVLFPLSIKNQKNQMDRARLAPKLERVQKKYAKDRQKMMQKQQELYEKENVKMTGGCLPMLVQMLVLFSVIEVIYAPMTYIQQLPEQDITTCISVVDPHYADEEKANQKYTGIYRELNLFQDIQKDPSLEERMEAAIVKREVDAYVKTAKDKKLAADETAANKAGEKFDKKAWAEQNPDENFQPSEKDLANYNQYADNVLTTIVETGEEFSIFGVSLLEQPWQSSLIPNWLWIIAIASGVSAFFSGKLSMKYSKAALSAEQQAAGGCSNGMMLWMMPLMSLFFSFNVPAGVAVYWVFSNLLAMVQTVVLNKMYNPAKARAQAELEYMERRRRKKEEKERLRQIHLEEQAAWQQEENEKRAQAKGDITKKKSANTPATPADLPVIIQEEAIDVDSIEEESKDE